MRSSNRAALGAAVLVAGGLFAAQAAAEPLRLGH
jgi:hypothetical protein